MLARTIAREGELAIRAALGAGRGRLVRGLLAQALVLAALGTAAGLLLASWLTPVLVALSPEGSDATGSAMREFDYTVRLDWPVFAFATGALLLAGAFGLLPAWRGARTDLRSAMSGSGRSATLDRGNRRLLAYLVVGEIAAAAVLLVAAVTLTQYFSRLVAEQWGFATDHRLTFNVTMPSRLFATADSRLQVIDRTLGGQRALPGVPAASATLPHPLNSARQLLSNNPEGTPPPEPRGFHLAYLRATDARAISPTAGQALLHGRDFTAADRGDTEQVCIINETMARRFWPNQDPLGKRIKIGRLDSRRPWLKVVGITIDTKAIADPIDGEINGSLHLPRWPRCSPSSAAFDELIPLSSRPPAIPAALEPAAVRAALASRSIPASPPTRSRRWRKPPSRRPRVAVALRARARVPLRRAGLWSSPRDRALWPALAAGRPAHAGIRHSFRARCHGRNAGDVGRDARYAPARRRIPVGCRSHLDRAPLRPSPLARAPVAGPRRRSSRAATVLVLATALACWFPARRAGRADPIVARAIGMRVLRLTLYFAFQPCPKTFNRPRPRSPRSSTALCEPPREPAVPPKSKIAILRKIENS